MKRLVFILFCMFTTISAQKISMTPVIQKKLENQSSSVYQITQKESLYSKHKSRRGKIKIIFEDFNEVLAKTENQIKEDKIELKKANELRSMIPKGGIVYVLIFRSEREEADLNLFTYVLQINKNEVARQGGGSWGWKVSTSPGLPSNKGVEGDYWTNVDMFQLEEPLKEGTKAKFIVFDKIGGKDEFTIQYLKKIANELIAVRIAR